MNLHFNNLPDVSGGNGFEEKILFLFPEIETEFIFPGKWRKANEAKTFSLRQSLPQYGLRTAYRQEEENNANFHSLLCFSFSNKSQISFLSHSLSHSLSLSRSLSLFSTHFLHILCMEKRLRVMILDLLRGCSIHSIVEMVPGQQNASLSRGKMINEKSDARKI